MNLKNHPNVFMLGAPKCGTSAMSHFLAQHPNVFCPDIKEPKYYIRDIVTSNQISFKNYLKLYSKVDNDSHCVIVDDNVFLLYSDYFLNNVFNRVDEPRFIVMLRNPLHSALSLYLQTQKSSKADYCVNFNDAWEDLAMRHLGKTVPNNKFRIHYLYDEVYLYAKYLSRFYNRVSSDNIKVILYDDFLNDNSAIYMDLISWLGLPQASGMNYKTVNPMAVVKKDLFSSLLCSTAGFLRPLWHRTLRPIIGPTGLSRFYLTEPSESSYDCYKALPTALKQKMLTHFMPDIEKLEQLIDRDLSHWKQI